MSKSHIDLKNCFLNSFKSFKHLKQAHGRLYRLGLHQDSYLLSLILRYCFDFSQTEYAQIVFREAAAGDPNLFLLNTMIRGLASTDRFEQCIHYYDLMRSVGVLPDNFTFPFVLKAASRVLDYNLGLNVHTLVFKLGFNDDVYVKTSLLCLYAKCGRVDDARKVFDDMPDRNVVSWTAIISGYIGIGQFKEAVDMFKDFVEMGSKPDGLTLVRVLSACGQSGDLESGEWIHKYVRETDDVRTNVYLDTSLIDMYAKCGSMGKAREVFDGMAEKDIVVWSAMIQGYASNGLPQEALDMFFKMEREGLKPDCYSIVGVLSACARLGALELGSRVVSLIDHDGIFSNPVLGTALIDMYAKCGAVNHAWRIFIQMKERDLVVWNAVISGLAMNGHVDAAFALFGQMQKLDVKPNGNTFIGLLCGCTHAGLVKDGRQFFRKMSCVYKVAPCLEHYGCMVDLLGRAGLLDEAHKMIGSMPMDPNTVVWGALLSGCRLHKNMHLAETALEQLIQLEPSNAGNYVLLSNVYSVNKKWKEAEQLRSNMNVQGVQKSPGCSWIEVEGIVHEFLVGDKSHPLTDQIYAKLEELMNELREVGYVPTTDSVLFDIEEEEKEHSLGYHSEKLAIAFGLISTPKESVIRIVKNLRICGDCHDAIKLISKVTEREIVVRDTNRFHCFLNGLCSCKDYW